MINAKDSKEQIGKGGAWAQGGCRGRGMAGLDLGLPGFVEGGFTARPVAGSHWSGAGATMIFKPSRSGQGMRAVCQLTICPTPQLWAVRQRPPTHPTCPLGRVLPSLRRQTGVGNSRGANVPQVVQRATLPFLLLLGPTSTLRACSRPGVGTRG